MTPVICDDSKNWVVDKDYFFRDQRIGGGAIENKE
jgi:hypothetical protein